MALRVLDGNQTATTLSSVVTGGEHIVAHTVVSLGATAIANIASAVSGVLIAGTVTANIPNTAEFFKPIGTGGIADTLETYDDPTNQMVVAVHVKDTSGNVLGSSGNPLPISGTVTANGRSDIYDEASDVYWTKSVIAFGNPFAGEPTLVEQATPLPISGTVTIGNTVTIGSCVTHGVTVANSVTIGAMPNGTLTTCFGTPTTANTAFATSAVTNANRKYLLIQNVTTGSNVITVGIGFTPTTTQGIQLTAGAGITFESSYIPTGAVQILSSVTASNFTILEA